MTSDFRPQRIADLLHAARILERAGMCVATDGNYSVRSGSDRVLVTRCGISKRDLTEESFVEIELANEKPESASSEWPLHRALYLARPEVACVLHVHSPYLSTFAAARRVPSIALLAEAYHSVGEIVLVPFCRPGSRELGTRALESSATALVYLLANHGAVAMGTSVVDALHRLERAEFLARVSCQCAAIGGGIPLSPHQITAPAADTGKKVG